MNKGEIKGKKCKRKRKKEEDDRKREIRNLMAKNKWGYRDKTSVCELKINGLHPPKEKI